MNQIRQTKHDFSSTKNKLNMALSSREKNNFKTAGGIIAALGIAAGTYAYLSPTLAPEIIYSLYAGAGFFTGSGVGLITSPEVISRYLRNNDRRNNEDIDLPRINTSSRDQVYSPNSLFKNRDLEDGLGLPKIPNQPVPNPNPNTSTQDPKVSRLEPFKPLPHQI